MRHLRGVRTRPSRWLQLEISTHPKPLSETEHLAKIECLHALFRGWLHYFSFEQLTQRERKGPAGAGTTAGRYSGSQELPIGVRGDQDTNSIKRCDTFLDDVPSTVDDGQSDDS